MLTEQAAQNRILPQLKISYQMLMFELLMTGKTVIQKLL